MASTGIVLSGGGARGAYEAGVVAGLVEVLRPQRALFDVLCGTSVGALNATFLAAHAHRPDMNVAGLISQWQALDLGTHLRLDMRGLLGWKWDWSRDKGAKGGQAPRLVGRSLLDTSALEKLVGESIPFDALHDNVANGTVRACVVAALHIATGKTTLFGELAPGVGFIPSRDPRRSPRLEPLTADHVLASSAIPLLFPARRVGEEYYCDGGVRFNTPLAPALRCGAERLVVVSLRTDEPSAPGEGVPEEERLEAFRSPIFLIGKVLNALLLDPLHYDLQILDRFNRLLAVLESSLPPEELAEVQHVIQESRGLPYRKVDTLVFRPSRDIGLLARQRAQDIKASAFSSWVLARSANLGALWESDLLSFILFDAEFAAELVRLGRDDTVARADEIRAFFADEAT